MRVEVTFLVTWSGSDRPLLNVPLLLDQGVQAQLSARPNQFSETDQTLSPGSQATEESRCERSETADLIKERAVQALEPFFADPGFTILSLQKSQPSASRRRLLLKTRVG